MFEKIPAFILWLAVAGVVLGFAILCVALYILVVRRYGEP